jgi:DNA-binding beta-propeller fold protein YncE
MHLHRSYYTAAIAISLLSISVSAQNGHGGYRILHHYRLGGQGGWDYIALDTVGHRLFIARDNRVMVVNPDRGKVLNEITGLSGAHGIAFAYATGHGFITSGRDSTVTMFDLKTLRVLGKVTAASDADAILYDPVSKHIFTFNGDARSATVIDPVSGKRIGNINLGAEPEFGVAAGDGKLYVNITNNGTITEIDATRMKITRQWSVAPCQRSTGLAIDRATHRLFSSCRSSVMAISNTTNGSLITTLPIGDGADATRIVHVTRGWHRDREIVKQPLAWIILLDGCRPK